MLAQAGADVRRVCVQVEHAPHPGHHAHKLCRVRQVQFQFQRILARVWAHADPAVFPVQVEVALVAICICGFYALDGVALEKPQCSLPVVGWAVAQL